MKEEKTKIITLSGSSKYCDIMAACAWILEKEEYAITMGLHLLPIWYPCPKDHLAESENVAEKMDELHLRKIDISDEVFVVNYDNYIGDSTKKEIEYAQKLRKPIRWFTDDKIGDKVNKIIIKFLSDKNKEEARR